jgi:hypothetical protein
MQTSALCHSGAVLDPWAVLIPEDIAGDNAFVLFNERLFPVKSYPTVDRAFRFFPTRYQEFYCANAPDRSFGSVLASLQRGAGAADFAAITRAAPAGVLEQILAGQLPGRAAGIPAIRSPGAPDPARFGGFAFGPGNAIARRGPWAPDPARFGPVSAFFGAGRPAPVRGAERAADIPDHAIPPGVDLSPGDRAAVARLAASTRTDLHTVVQVFCACERNEAAAEGCLIAMGR